MADSEKVFVRVNTPAPWTVKLFGVPFKDSTSEYPIPVEQFQALRRGTAYQFEAIPVPEGWKPPTGEELAGMTQIDPSPAPIHTPGAPATPIDVVTQPPDGKNFEPVPAAAVQMPPQREASPVSDPLELLAKVSQALAACPESEELKAAVKAATQAVKAKNGESGDNKPKRRRWGG